MNRRAKGRALLMTLAALVLIVTSCGDNRANEELGTHNGDAGLSDTDGGNDPDDGTFYRCDAVRLDLDELLRLPSLRPPSTETFQLAMGESFPGSPDDWVQLQSGYLLQSVPLSTTPPALSIAIGDGVIVSCTAVLETDDRAVAWRVESIDEGNAAVTIAIEACIDVTDLIIDLSVISGDAVISILAPTENTESTGSNDPTVAMGSETVEDSEPSCAVDGSQTLEVALPAEFGGDVLSAQTWPFVAPNPSYWVTATGPPGPRSTGEISQPDPASIRCTATGETHGVSVSWWDVPSGANLAIIGDGEPLLDGNGGLIRESYKFDEENPLSSGAFTEFGAPSEPGKLYELRLTTTDWTMTVPCGQAGTLDGSTVPSCTIGLVGGKPQLTLTYPIAPASNDAVAPLTRTVIRDDVRLNADDVAGVSPIDTSAKPGVTYRYQIELDENLDHSDPVVVECGPIAVPQPTVAGDELRAAAELFQRLALGPHTYLTVVTDGSTRNLYLEPSRSFAPAIDETFLNPFTLHQDLADAIDDGSQVSFEIDGVSGLPTRWTVDGKTKELVCLEVDTAPPSLRTGECNPTSDLISVR